jgi:hypothetical protein
MTEMTIPNSPEELESGWLTDSLRGGGAIGPRCAVTDFETELIGQGAGLIGTVVRIRPSYEEAVGEEPVTIIGKFSTTNEQNRDVAADLDLYAREVNFYRELAPALGEGCPACYLAILREDRRGCVILLEDFPDHAPGDQVRGCSLEEAEMVMRSAARFHATWWEAERPKILAPYADDHGQLARELALTVWPKMVSNWGHLMPPYLRELGQEYFDLISVQQRSISTPPNNTVAQGDMRLDNILFADGRAAPPLVMVDYQGPVWAKGVYDLSYFLTQSIDTDLRREHERSLLDAYRAELATLGIEYDAEECWQDYRRASLCTFALAVSISGALDADNDRTRNFMRLTISRASTAFDDLKLLDLLREGA